MRAPWKRAAVIALATCSLSALPLLSGCKTDVEKADKIVNDDLDQAADTLAKNGPDGASKAMQSLQKTTTTKGASPEAQIASNTLLAQSEVTAADRIINGRVNEPGITQAEVRIARLVGDMATLAAELDVNNVNIAGYRALDPAGGRKAVQQAVDAAQKGDNGVWIAGTAPLPALDALKQREQDLQKQIADLTQQRDDLTSKRGKALQEAGKFGQQADSTTGKESVGFYTQAANQRKEAADDETNIHTTEGKLMPLQQDLALVQLQEKAIGDVITGFGDHSQQIENGWKAVQQRIDESAAFAKSLLEGAGAAPDASASPATAPAADSGAATPSSGPATDNKIVPRTLAGLGEALDREVTNIVKMRAEAVQLLSSAFTHYDAASGFAKTLNNNLTSLGSRPESMKLPERRAWQEMISINSPAGFDVRKAAVQSRLARLFAHQYSELGQRNRLAAVLAPVLKQSGMTAPQALTTTLPAGGAVPDEVDKQVKGVEGDLRSDAPPFQTDTTALVALAATQTSPIAQQAIAATQANLAYKWSATLLTDAITQAGQGDMAGLLVNVAHAAMMADNYGAAQFASLQGKQQEADSNMKAAVGERDTLVDANARYLLPTSLPPGLAFPVAAVVIAPTSAPAPAPAAVPPAVPTEPGTTPPAPATAPSDATTPPATSPATPPADGSTPATTPAAPPATPPADGTTPPPATPPAAPPATPPADGTTPPPAAPPATPPADGATPPATPPTTPPATPPAQ